MNPSRIHDLRERLQRRFGCSPQIIAMAPGRVNLIGEHTDYNDGLVLPMAIDRMIGVAMRRRSDDTPGHILLHDLDVDVPLASTAVHGGARLVLAVLRALGGEHPPESVDVLVSGDLPIGGGLSSSAALGCAAALCGVTMIGGHGDRAQLARLVREAEHEALGTPCGIMDMFVCLHAKQDHGLLLDCRTECFDHISLPPADTASLLIVDTGVRHKLAEGVYGDRHRVCHEAASSIGVPALRDATLAMLDNFSLSIEQHAAASHVITENTRVLLFASALQQGDLRTAGDVMFASHDSLRNVFQVSCDELDVIVDAARAARSQGDAYGARMTGGGFGGCAIVLVRTDSAEQTCAIISERFHASFGRTPNMCVARPSAAASVVIDDPQLASSTS